jgi:hypothetical protein
MNTTNMQQKVTSNHFTTACGRVLVAAFAIGAVALGVYVLIAVAAICFGLFGGGFRFS